MYANILVPHAGTKAGDKALHHAKGIAIKYNSQITILHVLEVLPSPPPSFGFSYDKKEWTKNLKMARNEMKADIRNKMTSYVDDLRKDGIQSFFKIMEGYPEDEISKLATRDKYDLVVMAKRRKLPGLKAILQLGSVSRKVLERISCPVLLIDGEQD